MHWTPPERLIAPAVCFSILLSSRLAKKGSVADSLTSTEGKAKIASMPSRASNNNPQSPSPEQMARMAASLLGKLGGSKGGKARAAKLSAERKVEIAKA